MEFRGKVVLLTGAAGTGKSTLSRLAESAIPNLKKIDFGQLLLELKREQGYSELTYEELRTRSAEIVTSEDVRITDQKLMLSPKRNTGSGLHTTPPMNLGASRLTLLWPSTASRVRSSHDENMTPLVGRRSRFLKRSTTWHYKKPWR
jgi:energy-coupling factor transporter ATP-binding protein EcfA2